MQLGVVVALAVQECYFRMRSLLLLINVLPNFLLSMKNNNSYLPLFFLCWAFLYTPLALLGVFTVPGSEQDVVTAPKPCSSQVSRSSGEEQIESNDFGCFLSVYDPVPGIWDCGDDHIVPFCLTDNPPGYGTK